MRKHCMKIFKIGIIIALVIVGAMSILVYLLRSKGSSMPSHLKPYFKDNAELDDFVKKQRLADDNRKKELTNPTSSREAAEYLTLNDSDIETPTFERAMQMVEENLKENPCDYGQLLGEIYAFSKAYKNSEKAYYYYYIGLSQNGYLVSFEDKNNDPPHYRGAIGDFRNEAQVVDLVEELGFTKIKQIDTKAREWLKLNNFKVKE
jgi:hypothetical protein